MSLIPPPRSIFSMNRRMKKSLFTVALVFIFLLALVGTFAWYSFSQRAFNPTWGETNHGCRLHDNWDGTISGERNWDVYIENFCESNIFVRIQLREFLSMAGVSVIEGVYIDDPESWPLYLAEDFDVHQRRQDSLIAIIAEEYGIYWSLGDYNAQRKVFMPTHNHARYLVDEDRVFTTEPVLFAHPQAYIMSEATGYAVDNIAYMIRNVAFDATQMTDAEDYATIGYQTGPGDGSHDYWRNHPTGIHYAPLIYTYITGGVAELRVTNELHPHERQETLTPYINLDTVDVNTTLDVTTFSGGIMTLNQWTDLGFPTGNFWILDTTDDEGWFYWNGYLPPGEATSLLVDDVFIPSFNQRWDYVTSATADCFTCETLHYLELAPDSALHAMLNCQPPEQTQPPFIVYNRRLEADLPTGTPEDETGGIDDE